METTSGTNFWWLKTNKTLVEKVDDVRPKITSNSKPTEEPSTVSSSLREFLERERALESPDTDIGSIIEEINKLAAESPLGPYERDMGDRSFEEIMKEAEKIYMESSKSFEQLSARSRTSANLSVSFDETPKSTPTPKSASPLPLDFEGDNREPDEYSDDFEEKSEVNTPSAIRNVVEAVQSETNETVAVDASDNERTLFDNNETVRRLEAQNLQLLESIDALKKELTESNVSLGRARTDFEPKKAPEFNGELEKALEELKDSKEANTALHLQLDALNKTHLQLKTTYEELLSSNSNLEKRITESESVLSRCAQEIDVLKEHRDKLLETETNLNNLLEIEKMQVRNLKVQNEKDARCILDLNRQVKEMERIIARKHPDSVSALIVAAKNDQTEGNLSARKVLEDRIKNLETEVVMRDQQSSKVFLEVQEKFTEMKNKYESHIEDLELHVNDLKDQIKRRGDTFDVYTQTMFDDQKPVKETKEVSTQTPPFRALPPKSTKKTEKGDVKDDAFFLSTIRGLQADLVNKEKVIVKMQKDLDEAKKTNARLQKEREGSLKNIAERREFRSYPEKLALQMRSRDEGDFEEELKALKLERNKMKSQLCQMEEDYQNLKQKRLFDLSALQQAHEGELKTYMSNISPLREQLECQRKTIEGLQEQLSLSREQIAILRQDREDLIKRVHLFGATGEINSNQIVVDNPSSKKVTIVERKCEEHECRLRSIIQDVIHNQMSNRGGCQQCLLRQQQLILYKTELDHLLATVRNLV
uniref:Centrosomal protein of 162 kDa n=1 Tax=Photinus pyralis TaxID=7054 RepID=A0A1Y1MB80_PHOPY